MARFCPELQSWLSSKPEEDLGLPGSQPVSYCWTTHVTKNPSLRIQAGGLRRPRSEPASPSSFILSIQIKLAAAGSKLPSQPGPGRKAESLLGERMGYCSQADPTHLLSTFCVPGAHWGYGGEQHRCAPCISLSNNFIEI